MLEVTRPLARAKKSVDGLEEVQSFLGLPSPSIWVDQAIHHIDLLLIDHAHCEMKAASTALSLMFRYSECDQLLTFFSPLAREEMLHFEQVREIMTQRGVQYTRLSASDYAAGLRTVIRKQEPDRLVDTLIVGAFIEARSCERFAVLADRLEEENIEPELVKFYRFLLHSESRHFREYLMLAKLYAKSDITHDIDRIRLQEHVLIQQPAEELRFHSGPLLESVIEQK
ncbi:MAG: tRNA-(ms[2]io[6]A)-hydroxylase [Pseudomonadota bacterium]